MEHLYGVTPEGKYDMRVRYELSKFYSKCLEYRAVPKGTWCTVSYQNEEFTVEGDLTKEQRVAILQELSGWVLDPGGEVAAIQDAKLEVVLSDSSQLAYVVSGTINGVEIEELCPTCLTYQFVFPPYIREYFLYQGTEMLELFADYPDCVAFSICPVDNNSESVLVHRDFLPE